MWFNKKINPEKIKLVNTKRLQSKGINVIDHLPHLDSPKFRNPQDIAKRAMILTALFQLHLNAPKEIIKKWIIDNKLENNLFENEQKYLEVNYIELTEQDQAKIYWFIEAVWTLAWVNGLHNKLTLNSGVDDNLADLIPNIAKDESASNFIKNFKTRKEKEVFEMLDKLYRAHWFARNNNLKGIANDKVNLDIIIERRKALEFVCYDQDNWNEIELNT